MLRKHQVSAGLLAFRRTPSLEVLLAHPGGPFWAKRDDGAWTIPKGLVEAGADLLESAQREFHEETSFKAHGPFVPLGAVRQKSGKTVHGFAFEGDFDLQRFRSNRFDLEWPPKSGRRKSFPEIDRIGWFGERAAQAKIIGYQRPFLQALKRALG